MADSLLQYFMQKKDQPSPINIEDEFKGLSITLVKGVNKRGKPKNIFIRKWAQSNITDVYIPKEITYDDSEVLITFILTDAKYPDSNIQETHDAFIDYVSGGIISFYDNYRNRRNDYIMLDEYEPTTEDYMRGVGNNFVIGTIKLTKINSINQVVKE